MRGWVCRRVTACRRRRVATGLRRMFASHEWVGACRDAIRREHTAWDCANLACAAAATVGCLRRLSRGWTWTPDGSMKKPLRNPSVRAWEGCARCRPRRCS